MCTWWTNTMRFFFLLSGTEHWVLTTQHSLLMLTEVRCFGFHLYCFLRFIFRFFYFVFHLQAGASAINWNVRYFCFLNLIKASGEISAFGQPNWRWPPAAIEYFSFRKVYEDKWQSLSVAWCEHVHVHSRSDKIHLRHTSQHFKLKWIFFWA